MKNYLIITLGTRDIQILKANLEANSWNIHGEANTRNSKITKDDFELEATNNSVYPEYLLVSPRKGGEYILKHLPYFLPIIELPLIQPLLNHLQEKNIKITNYLIIYTDQEQSFKEGKIKDFHLNNDTLYFKEIVLEIFKTHTLLSDAQSDEYGIFEQVANIDFQYDHFAVSCKDLLLDNPDNIGEILLLPQGGIDQINHAITLQLLQAFKHKVRLFQQPESSEPIELTFNKKFLNDLNKQKIQKHLDDYDFGLIDNTLHRNKKIHHLAQYAYKRLSLKNNQNQTHVEFLKNGGNFLFLDLDNTDQLKLRDLYISSKISLKHQDFNSFLWKIFTFNENLFSVKIEEILGKTEKYFIPGNGKYDENVAWVDKLNRTNTKLVPELKKQGLHLSNPNRKAFFVMLPILFPDDPNLPLYQNLARNLEILSQRRNKLAHKLGSIDKNELKQLFGNDYSLENLISDIDQLFNLQTPFGIYDQIKEEIEKLL